MEFYNQKDTQGRNLSSLVELLTFAKNQLIDPNDFRLVSIQLKVPYLDPLAVLTEIHSLKEWHYFCENSSIQESSAAAGKLWSASGSGKERFQSLENAYRKIWDKAILAGDFSTTHPKLPAFYSFSFYDKIDSDKDFPEAELVIPKWIVEREQNHFRATANCLINQKSNPEQVAAYIFEAHRKFLKFEYSKGTSSSNTDQEIRTEILPSKEDSEKMIDAIIKEIKGENFYKIVLSRRKNLFIQDDWNALAAVNRLRKVFPACYTYSLGNENGVRWIGASPEQLFNLTANKFKTVALAGTTRRDADARVDASLGLELLQSTKNISEQNIVHTYLRDKLESLGLTPESEEPILLQLHNVQHILSSLSCNLEQPISPWFMLEQLHPTPALGGYPRGNVRKRIRELEKYERGLYGGGFGIIKTPHEACAAVAIRCARIEKTLATLYAGAGIMTDSDVEEEFIEMENKFHAVEDVLRFIS